MQTSDYLKDTAVKHIEGEISIDEVKKLINGYYQSKTARTPKDEETEEADKVSANIAKILNEQSFAFSVAGFTSIHRRLFEDIFKFADNSWYFRNALVRANYRNVRKEVEPDMSFLILFFRNLMMGENHELKNRYMIINTPQQSTEQVPNMLTEQLIAPLLLPTI